MKNDFQFNSLFIHEFCPGKGQNTVIRPEIVYHYTGADAFLNIISGQSVRFSDIRYMNDKSETMFCIKRIIEFIEDPNKKYPAFRDAVNALLQENSYDMIKNLSISSDNIKFRNFPGLNFMKERHFIFCTSKDADSLNMWNYYASNGTYTGYNLGLSVPQFLKTFDVGSEHNQDAFVVYYGNVLYEKEQQFSAIEELATTIEASATRYPKLYSVSKAAVTIRVYIESRGAFFKDSHFKSENEYRFLFSIAEKRIPHKQEDAKKYYGIYNQALCEGFCVKRGLIVPFMKVSIPENAISRITMAPMVETEIAKNSVKELLSLYGFKTPNNTEVSVYKSKIPIRF